MAPTRFKQTQRAPSQSREPSTRSLEIFEPLNEDSDTTDTAEKDETEERLERLLFGDEAGFLESLKPHDIGKELASRPSGKSQEDEQSEGAEDLENIPDEDLFFLDSGAGAPLSSSVLPFSGKEQDEKVPQGRQPVWVDSDDDRLLVSLATNTRLRKLRNTDGEDMINGREYIERLRRQYQHLHPTPDWAKRSSEKNAHGRKRRTDSMNGQSDLDSVASDSDDFLHDEFSIPSKQPLAELLRSAGSLTRTDLTTNLQNAKRRKLRPEVIDIQKTKSVTVQGPSSVESLQFHPYYPLLLSSGPSSTVYLHYVSPHTPNPNPLLTSLHVKRTPLRTTAFCPPINGPTTDRENPEGLASETRIFLSSRRRYFHTWSLTSGTVTKVTRPLYGNSQSSQRTLESFKLSPCGRYMGIVGSGRKDGGNINVLSTQTMQWLCTCRIDSRGGVADFAWWGSGDGFVVAGKNGECSEYEISARRVAARWMDEGAVGTTIIAMGGDRSGAGKHQFGGSRWVAIGSSSGIVNLYDRDSWGCSAASAASRTPAPAIKPDSDKEQQQQPHHVPSNPKPTRTFEQLTTPTSHLLFSSDGQMMVMASRWKRDALRLIHLPSCAVYRNWPTSSTPLGRISSVALSPNGGLLAVGNEQGKIRLWEIRD